MRLQLQTHPVAALTPQPAVVGKLPFKILQHHAVQHEIHLLGRGMRKMPPVLHYMQRIHAGQCGRQRGAGAESWSKFQQNKRFSLRQRQSCERPLFTNGQKTYRFSLSKNVFGRPGGPRLPQQAVPGDRRGDSQTLCLPVAPKAQGKRVLAEKDGAAGLSRHAKNAGGEPIRHAERLRIRLFGACTLILLPV